MDRPEDGEGIVREPVAYVVQSLPDGSIGNRIAVTAWTTFPAEREKLEQDTWVKAGCAKLAPLYSEARIAQDAQEIAALKAELRNIAEADYRKWDEGMRDPQSFVDWAKSRARHALAAHPKESP